MATTSVSTPVTGATGRVDRAARRTPSRGAQAGILVAAVAAAIALNAVIAAIAVAAGAPSGYAPLMFPVFAACTIVPMIVGWFLWRPVARRVRNPRRSMPLLALAVLVVSYVPDVILLATGFIPDTTPAGVVALMAMHVVVIAAAVVGYSIADRPERAEA
jgi:Kef-type K+ transport system membrane component KefB